MSAPENRIPRWWMGGIAAAGASCFTQGLDTVKVHMQMQHQPKLSMYQITVNIIQRDGILALNNGLTAAVVRQMTYSMFRFAFYEVSKQHLSIEGADVPLYKMVCVAAVAGTIGGFIGTPPDLINVRMQSDTALPRDQRRNYKNVFDGLARVYREEGMKSLFAGAGMAMFRSCFMTIGQLCFYDQSKGFMLEHGFEDNLGTHFTASLLAGAVATTFTQPMDVVKTVFYNAKPGTFRNLWHVLMYVSTVGPFPRFYKGYALRFFRMAPQTIITFVFLEQLRLKYGTVKKKGKFEAHHHQV